jgi:hypothetical protein
MGAAMLNGSDLYRFGVGYHSFGTVKNKTLTYGYFYKCDKITEEQKAAILAFCPYVEFKTSSPQYATELKNPVIIVLSKAQIKRNRLK